MNPQTPAQKLDAPPLTTNDATKLRGGSSLTPAEKLKTDQDHYSNILGKTWLTDEHLWKYFELLNEKILKGGKCKAHILSPLCSHALKADSDIRQLIEPFSLESKDLIMIQVNDSMIFDGISGTHWSLLMFSKRTLNFYYYDSIKERNLEQAKLTAKNFTPFLRIDKPEFKTVTGPQQENSYNCGIFLF
ncbi:SUMO1 sentrin specific peptidase 8 [Homalodisca vitripennis]|nr:SUMO1 sentrin specific peptidase 8 [Homalodisca vitripennis]